MRITLVVVGRLKERFWTEAADEYLKRLRPYCDVRVVEIADRDPSRGGVDRAMAEEAADALKAVQEGSHVIALDIGGAEVSSEGFATLIEDLGVQGRSSVTFVIGGSHGLSGLVLSRSDQRLSLGRMTLPHNLARVVLLEQIYRAFRIIRGEPYHK